MIPINYTIANYRKSNFRKLIGKFSKTDSERPPPGINMSRNLECRNLESTILEKRDQENEL